MRSDETKLRLTIDVAFELGRTDIADLKAVMAKAAEYLADHDMFTGGTEASVTEWECYVEQM